jgi:tetratricopeptide (TPR) repeat protein
VESADRRRGRSGPPLIGRADVRGQIDVLLDETREGTGRGLLLRGAGGVGKTELLRATVERARELGFRVAVARGRPVEQPAPFSLIRELVASLALGTPDPDPDAALPVPELPPLFVPLVEPAGEDEGAAPKSPSSGPPTDELERVLAPLGRTTVEGLGAGRERHYGRLVEEVLELARAHPLLLAIDDLPFADRSSLEFLRRLAPELPTAPLAIVATAGDDSSAPAAVLELLGVLGRSPSFGSVTLRPFTVGEVGEFVTWLQRGTPPPTADVERWYAQTDGNPLFVEQVVRTAIGRSDVATPPAERTTDLAAVLLARIRALDDTDRRVLTYGAVLGREFDFARLADASGVPEERLTEAVDRLVQAGLLREKGDEVYEFVAEALRATVYAELTETRRRILHRRVGLALEARGGASDFELGRQFYLGHDDARTVEYSLRAARAATQAFDLDAAISHLARALEAERRRSDRDPRREVRLLTEYGRLLHEVGDLVPSETALEDAVELARAHGIPGIDLGRALLGLAWTRVDRGMYPSAEALAREAVDRFERAGTPRDLLSAHRVLGYVYWRVADLPRAESHQRRALEIAEREGTPVEQGHALVDVANTLLPRGEDRLEAALALYGRAADLFATADDPSARARVLMNRAVLEFNVGRQAAAYRDLETAIGSAERSRSPLWIGYCLLNLAQWKAEDGDPKAARAALERAERVTQPLNDQLAVQQIAMSRGMIAEAEGAFGPAEAGFRESLERARALSLGAETAELLYRLAQLAFHRGDRAGARAWLDQATAGGISDHRPDLAPRVAALAAALRAGG